MSHNLFSLNQFRIYDSLKVIWFVSLFIYNFRITIFTTQKQWFKIRELGFKTLPFIRDWAFFESNCKLNFLYYFWTTITNEHSCAKVSCICKQICEWITHTLGLPTSNGTYIQYSGGRQCRWLRFRNSSILFKLESIWSSNYLL